MSNSNEFILKLTGSLEQAKTKKQINADIRQIQKTINMLRITGTFAKGETKKELNQWLKDLGAKLNHVKLKGKIDSRNLKREMDKSLQNVTFKEIDALKVDAGKTKLKLRKVVADVKAFAERTPVFVNFEAKKEKLNNDLTTFLNKNTKIQESGALTAESQRIRELIDSINDKETLQEATDAFRLYESEVRATGYATKSTADKIKSMLSHIKKISGFLGLTSMAVSNFKKSLNTLKSIDTILTEISKINDKLSGQDLNDIGNHSFDVASKYGRTAMEYLSGVQEASRAGYKNAESIAALSLAVQSAGNMTAELANRMIMATDEAYKMNGSVSELTKVLDGMYYISNHNAVNMTELSEAMSAAGATATSLGISVEETAAALATMIAATHQSGAEVAKAFKDILLYIRQVSDADAGIDAEGLARYEAACNDLNVKLKETKNGMVSLRDPMEVLRELSIAYNKLEETDSRRNNLLSSVGGGADATQLDALLRRWDTYESMIQQYAEGTGSLAADAEKTADSWEGSLNRLQNSFDSFVNTLTNKQAVIEGISFFDRLIQGAETLVDKVGEIPVMLTALHSAMVLKNKDYGITQIWNSDKKKVDLQGNLFGIDFTAIKNMKNHFSEAEGAIARWNKELHNGHTDINDFNESVVQNNAQLKEYLSTCSTDAPASLEGYKSHLQAAGVSTDALRLKTLLLNAAISFGIGFALQKIFELADNIIHSAEHCKERVDNLMSSYQSALDEANSNAQTVEELADKYETLSKGVNNLGESVSLTTDEYAEYNKIVNRIADMFPSLIQGYTSEGNAILSLKGNVEGLRDAYKAAQQEAYNMLIVSGKDSNGNDIITNFQNLQETGFWDEFFDIGKVKVGGYISTREAIEQLKALSEMDAETYRRIKRITDSETHEQIGALSDELSEEPFGLFADVYRNIKKITDSETREQIDALSDIERAIGYGNYIYYTLGITADVTDEEFEKAKKQARVLAQTYQAEMDSALKNVQTLANAYLMTNADYASLDEQSQNAASIIVNSINERIASGFAKKEDVGIYVADIVNTIKTNPEVRNALVGLFTENLSELSPRQAKEVVDQYIGCIAEALDEDELELKIRFGFEDVDTIARNYNAVMLKATEKFSGVNPQYGTRMPVTQEEKELFKQERAALEAFAEENSINTQDEIAFWNQCLEESETKEEAMEKYLASAFADFEDDTLVPTISSSISTIATQLEPQFTELGKIYNEIFQTDDNGNVIFSPDSVDFSTLESLRKSFAEIGEEIGVTFDPAQLESFFDTLMNGGSEAEVKQAFNDLATAYLYSTDILEQLNDETANAIEKQLEQMGVVNAETVVAEALTLKNEELALSKEYLARNSKELSEATDSEVLAFVAEQVEAGHCGSALAALQLKKLLVNGTLLDTETDINNVMALAKAAGIATTYLSEFAALKDEYENARENFNMAETGLDKVAALKDMADTWFRMKTAEKQFEDEVNNFELDPVGIEFKTPDGGKSSASSSAAKQAEKDWKNVLDKETDLLEKQLVANVITFQEYTDKRRKIIKDYYRDGKIKAEEYYDALESMYNHQLSLYDRVVNAVTDRIDDEIDKLKDQREAIENSYQVRIDAIQEEIDALNKANDARQKQIDLEKAQYEAERARNQRVNKVYDGSQFVYAADMDAVRDAEDDLADKEFQMNISQLETQIELLKEEMENATKSLDNQIDALEAYKSKWNEISDVYQKQQDKLLAAEIMGSEWERDILKGRLDTLQSFTEQYIALQQAQADAAVNAARIRAEAEAGSTTGRNVGNPDTDDKDSDANKDGNSGSFEQTLETIAKTISEGLANATETLFTSLKKKTIPMDKSKGIAVNNLSYAKRYASGTDHARKGLNLVGEDGTETFIDNDGNVALVTKPTLIPMEGGEVVKNTEETRAMLDTGNIEPVQSEGMSALFERIRNMQPSDFNFQSLMQQPLSAMINLPNMDYSHVLNNTNPEQNMVHIDNISINCPNVTNNSGAEYIMKELRRLPLDAYQYSHRRNK
ncbi:MAG: phage tail tape measure protein [Lachnospiraceae bacterium]|nr:phage tail tape measure protein [Lachnospiraceae bacterium]